MDFYHKAIEDVVVQNLFYINVVNIMVLNVQNIT